MQKATRQFNMSQDVLITLRKKLRIKYLIDRILACILLVILGPLVLLVAFLIKVEGFLRPENAGPAFYTQPRISEGRVFPILKFRTIPMFVVESIREKPESRSITDPTRHRTRMGKIILKWYLDEMLQLWNIAKGEMSFIGPRPDTTEVHERILQAGFTYRNVLRGGLLGIVQACKSNKKYQLFSQAMAQKYTERTEFPEMLDEFYLQRLINSSPLEILLFDSFIMRKSLRTFFLGEKDEVLIHGA